MRTDALIETLANDLDARPARRGGTALLAVSAIVSAALFAALLGPRADLSAALATAPFVAKPVLTVGLGLAALGAARRLARPGARLEGWAIGLAFAPLLASTLVAVELAHRPLATWGAAWLGDNALVCLTAIPTLAAPLLAAAILLLRHEAPTRPRLAGAVAGLASAAAGASLYAFHCQDDSALFVATWYTLAILGVAGIGAIAGHRWLRW
ncbi:NrsF family protein [Salinarimonas sp.]|uniref:NrsF family protein n=1 Tax=Salinarimonas sp. TaxID=2766526 RepID=UPI0032D99150